MGHFHGVLGFCLFFVHVLYLALSCHTMSCHAMSCHVMPCHAMPACHAINMPSFVRARVLCSIGPVQSVISEGSSLGACWAMAGSEGLVTIQLPEKVTVDSVSVEHASRMVTTESSSAPREFQVNFEAFCPPSRRRWLLPCVPRIVLT